MKQRGARLGAKIRKHVSNTHKMMMKRVRDMQNLESSTSSSSSRGRRKSAWRIPRCGCFHWRLVVALVVVVVVVVVWFYSLVAARTVAGCCSDLAKKEGPVVIPS